MQSFGYASVRTVIREPKSSHARCKAAGEKFLDNQARILYNSKPWKGFHGAPLLYLVRSGLFPQDLNFGVRIGAESLLALRLV